MECGTKCKNEWGRGSQKNMYEVNQNYRAQRSKREYTVYEITGTGGMRGTSIFEGTPRTGGPRWRWGRDREEGSEGEEGEEGERERWG